MFNSLFFGSFFQKRNVSFRNGYYNKFSPFQQSRLLGAENAETCNLVMACFQGRGEGSEQRAAGIGVTGEGGEKKQKPETRN
jgi:hypothetical protein